MDFAKNENLLTVCGRSCASSFNQTINVSTWKASNVMSTTNLFGQPRQIGYVVRDIGKAMNHWVNVLGVGPWFYGDRVPFLSYTYQGVRRDDVHLSFALANSGEMQIELIQQRNDTPSSWKAFADSGREGVQHWSSVEEDYDGIYASALERGYRVEHEGTMARGRFAYFVSNDNIGSIFEVAEATSERVRINSAIRQAAIGWDGKDPIRTVWPT